MKNMLADSGWIWTPEWMKVDDKKTQLLLFRRKFSLQCIPDTFVIQVSADTRYKLYINGALVDVGPERGNQENWYYNEKDLAPYLCVGENVIAAQVLRYPVEAGKGNYGMWTTEMPGFYLKEKNGNFHADEEFRVKIHSFYEIVPENPYFAPLQIYEKVKGIEEFQRAMYPDFDDTKWSSPIVYPEIAIKKAVSPGNLACRTIPEMMQNNRRFKKIMKIVQSGYTNIEWDNFIKKGKKLQIPAHSKEIVEITAGEEMTGYLNLCVQSGKNTVIKILQSESYYQKKQNGSEIAFQKENREDARQGELQGFTDVYTVAGFGSAEKPEIYEPFWFRTFRYIQLEIETKEEPLVLSDFAYRETGYPLEVKTKVRTSDDSLKAVWDISERTLRRCMQETYIDCPFYEQLQYAMDSRSQILYTYAIAADDRLARKCMDDLRKSVRNDGMINCCYPQMGANVIPGFSIYYIAMVYDHMMYFDDVNLIKDHMPVIHGILRYFERNLNELGLVRKIGGPNMQEKYWSFIDWTPQWKENEGVPPATKKGSLTMESLLYILGLQCAAKLEERLNRMELAVEYTMRWERVQKALKQHCRDQRGLFLDGPGIEEYSQHSQVFAILTDTVSKEEGKKLLLMTLEEPEKFAQCSVAMAFYLFRALEKTQLYEWTNKIWNIWRKMVQNHCSTCVEDDVTARSDCHAWGALALYELPSVTLGVRPIEPGYSKIIIDPVPGYMNWAEGEVITPKGAIKVSWTRDKDKMDLQYQVPEGVIVENVQSLTSG